MRNAVVAFLLGYASLSSATAQDVLIDANGDGTSLAVGEHPTLNIVDGRPAVSYYDVINQELRFAINGQPDGLGAWTDVLVDADGDGTSTKVGRRSVLAVIGGFPAIAYHDGDTGLIRFAISSDVAGAAGTWTDSQVAGPGSRPSLADVGGFPAIAYTSVSLAIRFVINDAADGSGTWTDYPVASGAFSKSRGSLTVVDGRPAIAYQDGDNFGDLRFAINSLADGSGVWTDVLVDADGDGTTEGVGWAVEMQILDGRPAIAYNVCERKIFPSPSGALVYNEAPFEGARCYGTREVRLAINAAADGSGAWSDVLLAPLFVGIPAITLDPVRFQNWDPDLDLNSYAEPTTLSFDVVAGLPGAAYFGEGGVRYASSGSISGDAGTWTNSLVTTFTHSFGELSLASVAGQPAIAYYMFGALVGSGTSDFAFPWTLRMTRALDAAGTSWGARDDSGLGGGGSTDDRPTLDLDGDDVVLIDGDGTEILRSPIAALTPPIHVQGGPGNSTLTITAAMATAGVEILFNGGDGFNMLIIEAASVDEVAHIFSNETDGFVDVDCGTCAGGTMTRIGYLNLSPILDNLSAVARTFDFTSGVDEAVTLTADGDGASGNGISYIDSDVGGESVSFANPTGSLAISSGAGAGRKTYSIGALDTPIPGGFTTLTVDGADKADFFEITPVADYLISVDGGLPTSTCPGDALTFDLSGGAVIAATSETGGAGSVTFASPYEPVSFAEIESLGEVSLQIALNYSTLYATDDLSASNGTDLTVTVTNSGAATLRCASVSIDPAPSDWLSGAATTPGAPAFTSPIWTVPDLEAGQSQTLSLEGFVVPPAPDFVTFTGGSQSNVNAPEVQAVLELSWGFRLPRNAHANTALFHERTTSVGAYEGLLLGLFQGSPGIEGAVWCQIPDSVGPWPTPPLDPAAVSGFWRTCSAGLPFPLHVNDLFLDSNDVIWLAAWGSAGLYRSDDGGESWEAAPPTGASNFGIVYAMAEDASLGILYISANNGDVWRSLDSGIHWQQVTSLPAGPADTPWSLTTHPSQSGVIYAGTFGGGVNYSTDFGNSWQVLDDPVTAANENDALLDTDASGDDYAGHVFDLEFSPDGDYLFVGTGSGVWRADLATNSPTPDDFTGTWTQIGPMVDLGTGTVIPEVRHLAFAPDGGTFDLVGGTWGFGAYIWDDPTGVATSEFLALRESHVTVVAVSAAGAIMVGSETGSTETVFAEAGVATAIDPAATTIPLGYALHQNYPNPFSGSSTVTFDVPKAALARLSVFDSLGREVSVLVDGVVTAGRHEVSFSLEGLPAGVYLYRLATPAGTVTRKLLAL